MRWPQLLGGVILLALAQVASAQTADEIAVGYAWQHTGGNADAFASQYNLSSGLFLDTLHLDLRQSIKTFDRFELSASGFGAEPWSRASLKVDWDRAWSLRLDYSRRESFFALADFDLGAQRDRWAITRWTGSLTYDNWQAARVRVDVRDVERSGSEDFTFYGLGQPYLARLDLNERVQEAGVSLETRTLPVKLLIEQDVARYQRRDRGSVANGGQPVGEPSDYLLAQFHTPGEDTNTVPTTRVAAVYRGPRFELVANGLYRKDKLDADRNDATAWGNSAGVGTISIIDAVTGSAERKTQLGDLRLGFAALPDCLTLRVRGHYEEAASDSSLVGEQILRLTGPGGSVDFPLPLDDAGTFDRTDRDLEAEAEWAQGPFTLTAGYHDGSREIVAKLDAASARQSVTRDATGWNATGTVSLSRAFSAQVGWDEGTFERYVFRTDPQTTNRLWAKLRWRAADGVELAAYGSRDTADNPTTLAGLDQTNESFGVSATVTTANGTFASLSVDRLKLDSSVETLSFVNAVQQLGLSAYQTDLLTATLRGGMRLGNAAHLSGGVLHVKDSGSSWPISSWSYDLRAEVAGPFQLDYGVFANHWSYRQARSNVEDFDVTRVGVTVGRRL
ncbi:MAG: hypothetical protein ACHQQS_04795 [Thermoanaerobaculales bacterium]